MYSYRSSTYRKSNFDKVCSTFVKNTFTYTRKATYNTILPNEVNLSTLLLDYLDYAIDADNNNKELQDLVLDTLIITTK